MVNHYAIQSLSFWLNIKAKRGDVNRYVGTEDRTLRIFHIQDHNEVQDNRLANQNALLEKNIAEFNVLFE